jgi:hypothetical protein
MRGRDGPEMTLESPPQIAPFVTRHDKPVSRLIPTPKPESVTGNKRIRKPPSQKAKKPPQPSGYFWRKDGAGWELRKSVVVTGNNGEKKRKQPYVAHMSREAFGGLKRRHKGVALERAIAQWIADHDR